MSRWTFGFACVCVWFACAPPGAGAPVRVAVSIPPLRTLAARIGGDAVSVSSVMRENEDPHTFMPSPRSVAALRDCAILFTVGIGFEGVLCEKLERTFPGIQMVNVATGISTGGTATADHAEHQGGHGNAAATRRADPAEPGPGGVHDHDGLLHDPHVWLSIPNLMHIATTMTAALQVVAPARAEAMGRNLAVLKADLTATHANFSKRLAARKGHVFYVYHPAFGCFAQDYGLIQKSVEVDGKAPSPRQLAALIRQARRTGSATLFVQPQFQQRAAVILAARIGARVIPINPLSNDPAGLLRRAVDSLSAEP